MAKNDKFYTKPEVAGRCYNILNSIVENLEDYWILEPSAGDGAFLPYLKKYEAYDLYPENECIVQQDFYSFTNPNNHIFITLGNPPFGKKSAMAIDFFNLASKISYVVAFIVPVSFMKWSVQKELNKDFKLVHYEYLEENSFLDRGKDFSVRTVFQVWCRKDFNMMPDLRLQSAPPIKHEDFNIWQYNATPQALHVVDEDWTIAVYRQGYHDYNQTFNVSQREEVRSRMTGDFTGGKQQFFFIQPLTKESEEIIKAMDFNALAARNTATPGFGKGDFVSYYLELKNK